MKNVYILLAAICCLGCNKTEIIDVPREQEPEGPSSVHYYYSFKAGEVIGAEALGYKNGEFTPGCTCVYGDTLFIANTQSGHFSVELYSRSRQKKIGSLKEWTYGDATQVFNNYVEAIAVSGGRLYLANIGSSIDVFDVRTMEFITRIGNRNWGSGNFQLFHTHAMALAGDYIVVRMKNGLQVHLQSDVTTGNYQKVPYYSRGTTSGFDVNNGEAGNRKIQVIDTSMIEPGNNVVMTNDQTMQLDFSPRGIALYKQFMYISAADGSIRFYDRNKKEFFQTCRSVSGYVFKGAQKLLVNGDRLWVTDVSTKEVIGVDIYRGEIEEYE